MTERTLPVIRVGRSTRRTGLTWPAVVVLASVGMVSAGCTSDPSAGSNQGSGTAPPPSASTIHTATVTRLLRGVIASVKMPLGMAPIAATPGFGSLWVVGHHGSDVVRVNPRTDKVV